MACLVEWYTYPSRPCVLTTFWKLTTLLGPFFGAPKSSRRCEKVKNNFWTLVVICDVRNFQPMLARMEIVKKDGFQSVRKEGQFCNRAKHPGCQNSVCGKKWIQCGRNSLGGAYAFLSLVQTPSVSGLGSRWFLDRWVCPSSTSNGTQVLVEVEGILSCAIVVVVRVALRQLVGYLIFFVTITLCYTTLYCALY